MEFAIQAWSPGTKQDKEELKKVPVQRKMVCMVSGLGGNNYEKRSAELGLTSLEGRRHQADMLQVQSTERALIKNGNSGWSNNEAGDRATECGETGAKL